MSVAAKFLAEVLDFSRSCAENKFSRSSHKALPRFTNCDYHAYISVWTNLKKYWAVQLSISKTKCCKPRFGTCYRRPENQKINQHPVIVANITRHRMCRRMSPPKKVMRHQGQCVLRQCVVAMRRLGAMRSQAMCRHNVVRGQCAVRHASSQCIVGG